MKLDIKVTGPIDVNTYILKDEETKEAVLIDVNWTIKATQSSTY